MNRTMSLAAAAVAVSLLSGCSTQRGVAWNNVQARDQHAFLPSLVQESMRPAVIVTAGPTGQVVGTGTLPPAARVIVQGNEIRLVSQETYARMTQGAMGAGPASSPLPPMPAR